MELEYDDRLLEEAGRHFDNVANCIINKDFAIKEMPDKTKTCKECDIRFYCSKGG
jgi:radical SAM protein with 4Fe4S-binding SPASM domain